MTIRNEAFEVFNQGKEYLQNESLDVLNKGVKEVKESGKDWWDYVEHHPIQTMVFGIIGYFALKGLLKG